MEENKNYYLEEQIGDSGVADTRNPHFENGNYNPFRLSKARFNVGNLVDSKSKYDKTIVDFEDIENGTTTLDDERAERQSNLARLGNASVNNLVIAGTSIVGGTLGLVDGIFEAIREDNIQKMWDNEINNAMSDVQDYVRENMPIYRGRNYEDKNLLQKMGSGIFWADLVQNLGYAEGMLVQGVAVGSLLANAPKIISTVLPSLMASIGEASVEAIQNRNEEIDQKIKIAGNEYNKIIQESNPDNLALSLIDAEYRNTISKIQEDANESGNFVFGSNIALLTLSNALQFGKLFSGGYETAAKAFGRARRVGDLYKRPSTALEMTKAVTKRLGEATTEGLEEVSQGIISSTPNNYTDYNTFNESMFNPEKRETVSNLWAALGNSFSEALQDPNAGVEFATGFLTGIIGIPRVKRGGFPITLENNIVAGLREDYRNIQEKQSIIDEINERLQNDTKINEYYNGLVRNFSIQEDMNRALAEGDKFNYKNAESAQLISDIRMFDNIGEIKRLREIVNNSIDMSDEGITNIINSSPQFKNMTIEEVREVLEKKRNTINSTIDTYLRDKKSLEANNPNITNETLENAIFLKSQFRNLSGRYTELLGDFYDKFEILRQEYYDTHKNAEALEVTRNSIVRDYILDDKKSKLMHSIIANDNSSISIDERKDLNDKFGDLIKINTSLKQIDKSLKEILDNPNKSIQDLYTTLKNVESKGLSRQSRELENKLSEATDSKEFKDIILNANTNDPYIISHAVSNLVRQGNQLAINHKKRESLLRLSKAFINNSKEEDSIKSEAIRLLEDYINNGNEVTKDVVNTILEDYENTSNLDIEKLRYSLDNAVNYSLNRIKKIKDLAAYIPTNVGKPKKQSVQQQSTNINSQNNTVSEDDTFDSIVTDNDTLNNSTDYTENNGNYIKPEISQVDIAAAKEGDYRPFNEVAKEKYDKNYDTIYKYLVDNGAFEYVNNGNLKPGDKIGFMIDESFEASVKNESWYKEPVIFMVHLKEDGSTQVVGVLGSNTKFTGLENLRKRILDEYKPSDSETQFVSSQVTNVSKIMVGKVPFSNEEKDLSTVPGVTENSKFGIIKNGILDTNESIEDSDVHKPLDMSNKEGRVYLLVKSGSGKYLPVAVRVKHFNVNEYNVDDVTKENTPFTKLLNNAIQALIDSNENTFEDAYKKLENLLFLNTKDKNVINSILKKDFADYRSDILKYLYSQNPRIQVDLNRLNDSRYTKLLLDSDILTSNLIEAKVISEWFTTDYFDNEGKIHSAENPVGPYDRNTETTTTQTQVQQEVKGNTNDNSVVVENDVTGEKYTVVEEYEAIFDENNQEITQELPKSAVEYLLDVAHAISHNKSYRGERTPDGKFFIFNDKRLIINIETQSIAPYDETIKKYSQEEVKEDNKAVEENSEITGEDSTQESPKEVTESELLESMSDLDALSINDDIENLRRTTNDAYKVWDKEQEIQWLNKVLPQLSEQDRVKFTEGLIRAANGDNAWGMFSKGIITLSNIAAEGTTYHEAFHYVFNSLLDQNERSGLLREYSKNNPNLTEYELEELMAEDFRMYIQNGGVDNRSLGRKVLDFFKSLFIKVTNWDRFAPSSLYYFNKINNGNYANKVDKSTNVSRYRIGNDTSETNKIREDLFRKEAQRFLDNFGINIKDLDNYNADTPLFDALNRLINIRNANDLSEGLGYAIAFMMQYNPLVTELINIHYKTEGTFKEKGIRRALRRRGEIDVQIRVHEEKYINKEATLKEIGKDIAVELRKLYNIETPTDKSNSYIGKLWEIIQVFFDKLTPAFRTTISIISNNTKQIANAVKLNDASIIRNTDNKPGTESKSFRVDIGSALKENPYEDFIIRTLQTHNIALAGSASIALEGTLYRPLENPLHDIDFNAVGYSKNQLEEVINTEFKYNTHIRTINDGADKVTETYLIMDREFKIERPISGIAGYNIIDSNTGEIIGNYVGSELSLKEGVKGKFLDFFIGEGNRKYGNKFISVNDREYLVADYRNAFEAKIDWARIKDIWDYNRFVSKDKVQSLEELKRKEINRTKEKIKEAKIIWGHPAIGKTTYLERNDDIIEWDELINPKRNEFIRNQIDPNHTLDVNSMEYKKLRSDYMMDWKNHPEYVKFLTDNWNYLVEKAKRENKKLFASPLPLLEIGAEDIELIVAINNKDFLDRNLQRGGTKYASRGWKQSIDEALTKQDPNKIVYTSKYFSDFIREYLGVKWGTLTEEESAFLTKKGWTKELFDSISQEERDHAIKCML